MDTIGSRLKAAFNEDDMLKQDKIILEEVQEPLRKILAGGNIAIIKLDDGSSRTIGTIGVVINDQFLHYSENRNASYKPYTLPLRKISSIQPA